MLTFRQIEAFRAIVISRSFTRAAEMLNISQPAVSRLARDMEQELQFSLFERRKGGLRATDQALALYAEVERSFIGLQKIERAARRIVERRGGILRICGNAAFTHSFLPSVVQNFLNSHRGVAVSLHTYDSATAADLLRARQFDIGYVMTPADVEGLQAGPVYRARCVCLVPEDHRLRHQSVVRIEDLQNEPFISLADGTMTRMKIDAAFDAANVSRHLEIEAEWSASVCSLVREGLGFSIIEPFTAKTFAAQGGVVRPFLPEIDFTFMEIRKNGGRETPDLDLFSEFFEKAVKDYIE